MFCGDTNSEGDTVLVVRLFWSCEGAIEEKATAKSWAIPRKRARDMIQ